MLLVLSVFKQSLLIVPNDFQKENAFNLNVSCIITNDANSVFKECQHELRNRMPNSHKKNFRNRKNKFGNPGGEHHNIIPGFGSFEFQC